MKRFATCLLAAMTLAWDLSAAANAQTSARDKRMIAYAKNLRASRLDSRLPNKRFEFWLRSVVGIGTKLDWEINDCGEQSGNPNDGSSINPPLCAQAHAISSDSRHIYVLILVGTHKAGIRGRPTVWSISVDDHGTARSPGKLRDLVAALRK
jgi:hypothetical protein